MMRVFTALPDLPSARHILNPDRGWLSVIVPVARINLVTNPSFETATTNYTAVGGSIARSTTQQYHGAYSLAVTPTAATTDGVFYGTVSLTSGTTYAASCKIYGAPGVKYKISVATTGGVDLAVYRFVGTGRWQWVWVYWTETSSTTRRIYVTKDTHTSTAVFCIDGVQVEALAAGETVSTYIDGDQASLIPQFPPAYGWSGARHASTSYRAAQTRDGGQVKNLDLFKLLVTSIIGLGIADPTHIVASQGYTDGAGYQSSIVPLREFSVSGRFNTASDIDLDQQRKAIGAALNLDATAPRQPLALLYQKYDGLDPQGDTGKIIANYKTGLGGGQANRIGEDVTVEFTQWFPFITGHESGTTITPATDVTISDFGTLMRRDDTGVWSAVASWTTANTILDIKYHPNGTYYIVGSFTTLGGTAANRITQYNPATGAFTALGTGLSGTGRAIKVAPNGDLYVGGTFVTAGGVTVNNIAKWDGSTWSALGAGATKGVDSTVRGVDLDSNGDLYVTGDFANAGGAGAVRIAKWTLATNAWSALSTGLDATGFSIVTDPANNVYVSGQFTIAGGVAAASIAMWNGSAFSALGSGLGGALTFASKMVWKQGLLFIGGTFTTAGGLTTNRVAVWNGTTWASMGSGISGDVEEVGFGGDGLLYLAGSAWTTVGGITASDSFAAWNGSSFILPDLEMPGTTSVNGMALAPGGGILLSFDSSAGSGTAKAASLTTATNDGTARAYPVFILTGNASAVARLHQIRNYTTGQIVSFNLTVNPGEIVFIRTTPTEIVVSSTVRGDLSGVVLPGSANTLHLGRGANSIAFLATGGAITISMLWQKQYQAVEDLVY